jgi:hypothetical protein
MESAATLKVPQNIEMIRPNRLSKARFFISAALRFRMTGYDLGYFKFWNVLSRYQPR